VRFLGTQFLFHLGFRGGFHTLCAGGPPAARRDPLSGINVYGRDFGSKKRGTGVKTDKNRPWVEEKKKTVGKKTLKEGVCVTCSSGKSWGGERTLRKKELGGKKGGRPNI